MIHKYLQSQDLGFLFLKTTLTGTGLTAGDESFVKSNSRLYVSNGDGWYNTTLVNRTPRWDSGGEPDASYTIVDSSNTSYYYCKGDSDNGSCESVPLWIPAIYG